ncbi:solute carrier family 38 (sodium-coupled neutral amino acid transporter), member 11 [Geosmithia morbida]|uniref:Solute carrier family 38 (Sodium-coupled neutral amino acid transporter), member 11 n=1 Tax=Geosmithia morbida TaxID=1094350 RepID=A0A9P4YUB3_9HYPO|nr:solute carrier family 38 (sodium-coupled neutral amino acid transporter), member 11 [Geosmithia morbida]KAF4121957.1 solute carrier family 38 (sodium-coupled neutral amino acid transporter), member 11 [Geosmithia morbida]
MDDYDESHHRMPLLTDMEAPSVAMANYMEQRRRSGSGSGDDGDDGDATNRAEEQMRRPKSGLRSAFMNMANSIIGAGIIGQPYAMRQAGLLAGTGLLVGLTFLIDWTICLIVINSKLSGTSSFQGTVEHCFGRPGLIAISLAQWIFAFGGMVAFGVIVGDTIPHVMVAVAPDLPSWPVVGLIADRRVAIAFFCMGVSYPLTLYRDISKLAKASTLALVGMGVIVVTVVTQGVMVPSSERGSFDLPTLTVNSGVFQAIGVISFAFVCHHNSLLIYGSLKTPTIDNFSRVTHYSVGVSTVACLTLALAGFLVFGDRTLGNVLNNFPADNVMVNVARLCFGLNMLTTMPLEAFVCREVMETYFWPDAPFDLRRHVAISTGLMAGATVISLLTCDLGAVFELVGATSAVAMAYVMPPLCYIKLTTRTWRTYLAWGVVAFGCAVMVISVFQAVSRIISGGSSSSLIFAFHLVLLLICFISSD